MITDHFPGNLHQIPGLGRIAENIGGTHQNLFQCFGSEAVPGRGFAEGVGHVGHHGHMEMRAPAVFKREKAAVVQIGADKLIFRQAETVAAVGLCTVTRGGVRQMHLAGIPQKREQSGAILARVGRGRPSELGRNGGKNGVEFGQAGRIRRTVFSKLDIGVVAPSGNFRYKAGQTFAFMGHVLEVHEFGRVGDETRIERCVAERLVVQNMPIEGDGRFQPADAVFIQRALHDAAHLVPS